MEIRSIMIGFVQCVGMFLLSEGTYGHSPGPHSPGVYEGAGGAPPPPRAVPAQTDLLRAALRRDVVRHTARYLRHQLIQCVSSTTGARTKRKTEQLSNRQMEWQSQLAVDVDILEHTERFLFDRLLICRQRQMRGKDLSILLMENDDIFRPGKFSHQTMDEHGSRKETSGHARVVFGNNNKGIDTKEYHLSTPSSKSHSSTSIPTTQSTTTTTAPTTTEPSLEVAEYFLIRGRNVTCSRVELHNKGRTLQCRNIWVDGQTRLPNFDLCPPRYHPDEWRDLRYLERSTFKVFDVTNFCVALGDVIHVNGFVVNVRASWDCDSFERQRLKWQNSDWAGSVWDNGFMHDLECTYSAKVILDPLARARDELASENDTRGRTSSQN